MTSTLYNQSAAHTSEVMPLSAIIGISPLNPRHHADDDADIESVAANILASKQLQQLLVVRVGPSAFEVLDGGRRWRAMQALVAQGAWTLDDEVNVEIVAGSEAALREIALAANTMRRALHPVEEYEAFAAMADAGFDEARIAKDFGLGVRHVKQRLALGRLSPNIRAAWRAGDIDADIAQGFTAADTHAAQDAVFEDLKCSKSLSPFEIRRKLRSDALRGDCPEALYLGAEAYLAAGGRIDEDLFSEEAHFRDGSLLKRLAREKLIAEGEKIAEAEGWGFVFCENDWPPGYHLFEDGVGLDFTPAEKTWLNAIERLNDALDSVEDAERGLELEREIAQIHLRALLRTLPLTERARLGLGCVIDGVGAASFTRAFQPAEETAAPHPEERTKGPRLEGSNHAGDKQAPEPAPPKKLGKPLREILDAAIQQAFAASIRTRPDLALMVAVARMACNEFTSTETRAVGLLKETETGREPDSNLLARLRQKSFAEALAICAAAPLADLTSAFTELVSDAIDIGEHILALRDLEPLASALASRGAPLALHLDEALDREAYFAAATKKTCLDVAADLGTAVTPGASKATIAGQVAGHAKIRSWLPEPLATWAAIEASSPEAPRAEPVPSSPGVMPGPEPGIQAQASEGRARKPRAKKAQTAAEAADQAWNDAAPDALDASCPALPPDLIRGRASSLDAGEGKTRKRRADYHEAGAESAAEAWRTLDNEPAPAPAEAIDTALHTRIYAACEFTAGAPEFAKFLIACVDFAEGLECKASHLRAAYAAFAADAPRSTPEIGAMMHDLGIAKKRLKDGYVYLGIGLKGADA